MPRTIQLHPLSLLVGVGFALLGVVAMGQMPAAKRSAAAHDSGLLQVAHPRDWVVVEEGSPFLVPPGKLLVISALGSAVSISETALTFNGQTVLTTIFLISGASSAAYDDPTVKPVTVGLRAGPGTSVDVSDSASGSSWGRAWGYLVDA